MTHLILVSANFYEDIAKTLLLGARAELKKHADVTFEEVTVPGALEIPLALQMAAETGAFDGAIALGCVIRGETSHYDTVCQESARALMQVSLDYLFPIANGILTVESREQATRRANRDELNKGGVAAKTCLHMVALGKQFDTNKEALSQ